jgi:uncharacterized membrane protein
MFFGTVFFAGMAWLMPVTVMGAGALVFVVWSYLRSGAALPVRLACAVLKLLGIAALLACLLEPMWSREKAKPGANVLAVVADNSRSLALQEPGAKLSRGAEMRENLAGERNAWRQSLSENFEVRNYLADSRLRPTDAFADLNFDGRTSALGESLRQVVARHHGQPLAGIVLMTDGNASDLADAGAIEGLPPVYPVVFGSDKIGRDLAITNTAVTLTSFDDAPVDVQADVGVSDFGNEEIAGRLFLIGSGPAVPDAKPAAEEFLKVPRDATKVVFHFRLKPEKPGVASYRLTVGAKRAGAPEVTMANNEAVVTVDRGSGPYRVLYVSGRPNWEYKFLRRALDGEEQTQLVALIRIAKREPKFEFRGRAGESSNPLFRGFGNQSKEEIERYDQPVLVRLGTEDENELRGGFPKTAEELFRYRAIIMDDVEAEFFTPAQMSLLQRFVSERGGGFLMLGGAESFGDGNFAQTAVGEMLPVYLNKRTTEEAGELRLSLTREGWLQPWARLRTTEDDERKRLAELPASGVLNHVGTAKPAAMVIATVSDGKREYPALVTQRFGRGRTAAMLIGDLWHTGLGDEVRQKDLGRAWRQMVRWLVADVPAAVEVHAEPQADAQAVRLEVRARDAKFEPIENARVTVKIQRAGARSRDGAPGPDAELTIPAEPSPKDAGVYIATYTPRESGGYRVEATVLNESGANAGMAQTGWSTNLDADEFRVLAPNRVLMEALARKTGGEVIAADRLEKFARDMPKRKAPITETVTEPLWHTPWMFLFSLACFLGEWGLRRRSGLA